MFRAKKNLVPILAVGLALLLAGCIVSGTFVLDYKITDAELAKYDHLFYKLIDLTDEDVWQDHEENLDEVQSVGFEMWVTNVGPQTTFDLYVDASADPVYTDTSDVADNATQVVRGLTLAADKQTHITYGSSFKYITNVNVLTKLARTGMFNFYAIWTQESTITVDSLRVVVVLSASDS
jgi:hypothetical protein